VVIHRLRVGHSHLTHSYLLKKEQAPISESCLVPLTIEHVLISCSEYSVLREKYFKRCRLHDDIFILCRAGIIIEFVKEIGIYCKI
jgi:hypothetical protein